MNHSGSSVEFDRRRRTGTTLHLDDSDSVIDNNHSTSTPYDEAATAAVAIATKVSSSSSQQLEHTYIHAFVHCRVIV